MARGHAACSALERIGVVADEPVGVEFLCLIHELFTASVLNRAFAYELPPSIRCSTFDGVFNKKDVTARI